MTSSLISELRKKEVTKEMAEVSAIYDELEEIQKKTPQEAHKSIVSVLYTQQNFIQKLVNDNNELWILIQKYEQEKELQLEEHQLGTPQSIVKRIWDNKEDEFWDTL